MEEINGTIKAYQKVTKEKYPQDVETVVFEQGGIDIDTETDYDNLISQQ
jgi:molybdenum cofactor cytidylyltransferase